MSRAIPPPSLRERIRLSPRHTGGEFEAHLEGTASLLRDWGCSTELQQAGRYHSVYGNPAGRAAIASAATRELAAQIGEQAERLVRLWATIDRDGIVELAKEISARGARDERVTLQLVAGGSVMISGRVYIDLAHLHAANTLEMAIRRGKTCAQLDALRPLLRPAAAALLERQRRRPGLVSWWRTLSARWSGSGRAGRE